MVREAETKLGARYPVKVVERCGIKLRELIHKSNPMGGEKPCPRAKCSTCTSEGYKPGTCTVKGIVYENVCQVCKTMGRDSRYVGETHKTIYQRQREHVSDYKNPKVKSHMRDHHWEDHAELEDMSVSCVIKVYSRHDKPLERQLQETVRTTNARFKVLNSKTEYNRYRIPTIQVEQWKSKMIQQTGVD